MLFFLRLFAVIASVCYATYMFWYSTRIMDLRIPKVLYYPLIMISSFSYTVFFTTHIISYFIVYTVMLGIILAIYVISFREKLVIYLFGSFTFIFHLLFVKGIIFSIAVIFTNLEFHQLASSFTSRIGLTIVEFLVASVCLCLFRRLISDRWIRRVCQEPLSLKPLVLILTFLNFVLLITSTVYDKKLETRWMGICFLLLCLVVSFCLYYVLCICIENIQKGDFALRASGLEHQLQIQMQHYSAQLTYIENMRKIKHDYLNQLHGLSFLLESGDSSAAQTYLHTMLGNIEKAAAVYKKYSNHRMVDAILQDMAIRCAQNNVSFDAFVKLPETLSISNYDLCTIFSNLMNNALEASLYCHENRFIRVKQKNVNDWNIITQENSYDGTLIKKNGKIQTRKKDSSVHGIGIRQIQDLIKAYGGYTEFLPNSQNKIFTVSIFFHN